MKTELNVKQFQVNEFGIEIYFSQFMTSEQTQHQAQNDITFQLVYCLHFFFIMVDLTYF